MTFDIDANGILNVSAKDKGTGKEQTIRIEASSGLSDEEIEKMRREAEENADADKARQEEVDKLNQADSLVFSTEKQLKEYGDKIPADKKQAIEDGVAALKTAHQNKDMAGIESATESLNKAWEAASQDMYKDAGAPGGEQPSGDAETGDAGNAGDTVEDVDFEEVKED